MNRRRCFRDLALILCVINLTDGRHLTARIELASTDINLAQEKNNEEQMQNTFHSVSIAEPSQPVRLDQYSDSAQSVLRPKEIQANKYGIKYRRNVPKSDQIDEGASAMKPEESWTRADPVNSHQIEKRETINDTQNNRVTVNDTQYNRESFQDPKNNLRIKIRLGVRVKINNQLRKHFTLYENYTNESQPWNFTGTGANGNSTYRPKIPGGSLRSAQEHPDVETISQTSSDKEDRDFVLIDKLRGLNTTLVELSTRESTTLDEYSTSTQQTTSLEESTTQESTSTESSTLETTPTTPLESTTQDTTPTELVSTTHMPKISTDEDTENIVDYDENLTASKKQRSGKGTGETKKFEFQTRNGGPPSEVLTVKVDTIGNPACKNKTSGSGVGTGPKEEGSTTRGYKQIDYTFIPPTVNLTSCPSILHQCIHDTGECEEICQIFRRLQERICSTT